MNLVVARISSTTLRLHLMIPHVVDVVVADVDVEVVQKGVVEKEAQVVVEVAVRSAEQRRKVDHGNLLHAWMMRMTFLVLSTLQHDFHGFFSLYSRK